MKIIANKIPQISQAFTQIETPYIFNNGVSYVEHKLEWVKTFNANRDNEWELNVVIHDLSVNVKASGIYLYVDGVCVSNFGLRETIAKKFGLFYR
jgi:hypothetical protein